MCSHKRFSDHIDPFARFFHKGMILGHWLDRADTAPDDRVRYKRAGTRSRPDLLLLLLFFAPQLRTRARRGPVSYRTHRRMNGESPGDPSRDRAPCGKSSDIRGVSCRTPVGKTDTANRRPRFARFGTISEYTQYGRPVNNPLDSRPDPHGLWPPPRATPPPPRIDNPTWRDAVESFRNKSCTPKSLASIAESATLSNSYPPDS